MVPEYPNVSPFIFLLWRKFIIIFFSITFVFLKFPVIFLNGFFHVMIKQIRSFPSREFYGDSLQDGDELKSRTIRAWHDYRCFGPFRFFDIHEGKEARPSGSGSWINVEEVDFVLFLYQKLISLYPALKAG